MSRKMYAALSILAGIAGCAPPPPAYAPPTSAEASLAEKARIRGKIDSWKMSEPGQPGMIETAIGKPAQMARDVAESVEAVRDISYLIQLKSNLRSFQKNEISSCTWTAIERGQKEMDVLGEDFDVDYAYECKYEYITESETHGLFLAYEHLGYFYKVKDSFALIRISHKYPPRHFIK